MVKKKVRRKKKNTKFFTRLLIASVLMYLVIMSIPVLRSSTAKTTPVTDVEFVDSVDSRGIIVKNETLYDARTDGKIKFSVKEGTRVSKGAKVAEMIDKMIEDSSRELEEVETNIVEYKNSLSSDRLDRKEEIDGIVVELENHISQSSEEAIDEVKSRLVSASEKPDEVEKLIREMRRKNELKDKQSENDAVYYAEKSGIVSREIDGLESRFTVDSLENIKPKDLVIDEEKLNDKKINGSVKKGSPIFKILEDQEWFIVTDIKNNGLDKKQGDTVSIGIGSDEDRVEGTITKLEKHGDDLFLVIKLDKYLHKLYKKRIVDLNITKKTYSGLEVPKEAIVDKDGKKGVYIKDISGVVKFREIKVIKNTKDKSIVEPTGETKALEPFDEIFIDASKIREGQIVNYKGGD